jgi:hypothetical protein
VPISTNNIARGMTVPHRYAFNPSKIRFQSTPHHPKRFLRVTFLGLRAPARPPLAIACTTARLRAGSGGPPPGRAHASFRRSLHQLPSAASATSRQRPTRPRPCPCFSFAEPAPACPRPCPAPTQASAAVCSLASTHRPGARAHPSAPRPAPMHVRPARSALGLRAESPPAATRQERRRRPGSAPSAASISPLERRPPCLGTIALLRRHATCVRLLPIHAHAPLDSRRPPVN